MVYVPLTSLMANLTQVSCTLIKSEITRMS